MSMMTETFFGGGPSLYSQHLESILIIHIVRQNQIRLEKRKKRQAGKKGNGGEGKGKRKEGKG